MPRGSPAQKLSISVDADVHEQMVVAAQEAGLTVSGWITKLAREALKIERGLRDIERWQEEHGVFDPTQTVQLQAQVDEAIQYNASRRARRSAREVAEEK